MINLRRIYVYLVSAITLQSIVWATIALLRNLTNRSLLLNNTSAIAAQVAMIVVGLPIFLGHWLWIQRNVRKDKAEQASAIRRLYLDSMLLAFIIPIVNSTRLLAQTLLETLLQTRTSQLIERFELRYSAIALVVTLVMALYHFLVLRQDNERVEQKDGGVLLDQLLLYLLVIGGLLMSAFGVAGIIRFIIRNLAAGTLTPFVIESLAADLALIIAGLPLWLVSWRDAQNRFAAGDIRVEASFVRKATLYLIILLSTLSAVVTAAIVLANLLTRLLQVPSSAGELGNALSIIIVSTTTWAYHARIVQQDAQIAGTAGQAAAVRRIYLYLVSGIGLTAVLIGTGGELSVLLRSLSGPSLGSSLREQLAWFTAVLIAGLPVWLTSWRRIQQLIHEAGTAGFEERNAFTRRLYLTAFILAAVFTALGGAVYIVAQIVELLLESRIASGLLTDVGQALAYTLIAVAVLIYHGLLLREDQRALAARQIEQQREITVAIVGLGDGSLGRLLVEETRTHLPGIKIITLPSSEPTPTSDDTEPLSEPIAAALAKADLIITPWQLVGKTQEASTLSDQLADALSKSMLHKLILPLPQAGMTWIGVEPWQEREITSAVVETIDRFATGDESPVHRRLSPAALVLIVLATIFGLLILLPLVVELIDFLLENPF